MTNGEKIQQDFACELCEPIIEDDIIHVIFADKKDSAIGFDWSWWNAEYKEPTPKNDLGVDCISRTRAIERLKLNFPISQGADNSRDRHRYMQALADLQAIKELPSVTPQKRKGYWINHREHCEMNNLIPSGLGSYFWCSNCDRGINASEWVRNNYNYCPNCGCCMVESQESEG